MRVIVLIITLFLAIPCLRAQQMGCKPKVLASVRKMAAYQKPKVGKYYYFKVKTDVTYAPELSTPPTQLTSEIIIGHELAINRTNLYELYIDNNDQFFVLHAQKIINRNSVASESQRDSIFQLTSFYQDSLIRSSTEKECSQIKEGNRNILNVGFSPHANVQDQLGLKYLEVSINLKNNQISQVKNYFNGEAQVNVQTTTYQEIDYNYKGKVKPSASKYIFGSGNRLVERLKNYQLIDLRDHEALGVQ